MMDNYNNNGSMNYNFEPQEGAPYTDYTQPQEQPPQYQQSQSQYQYQNYQQYQTYQQPQEPKKPKKKTGRIVAVLLAVAIIGGLGGAGISAAIRSISDKNQAEQSKPTMSDQVLEDGEKGGEEAPAQQQDPAAHPSFEVVNAPLPDKLTSNDTGKSLTPAQAYAMNVGAVVGIRTEISTNVFGQVSSMSSAGTGFVLSEDGYIVTNHHVINGANTITVAMFDGTEHKATLIGSDAMNDVALLKIEATGLQAVTVGNTDDIVVGEEVIAIGNPLGELTFTMTQGYISALDREINTDGTPINMFQTDAAINSGNSGGPLFDMNGNVIGVTTAKYSGSTSSGATIEGIGFAIPINDVLRIVYDLQENGYVTGRAYFGVTVEDMDASTAKTYNLPTGAYVRQVNEGSSAEKAGIQVGDIIIGLGDEELETRTDLMAALQDYRAGDTVKVTVFRAGAEVEMEVTFDERPREEILDAQLEEYNQQQQEQQQQQPQTQPDAQNPFSQFPGFEEFFKDYYGNAG